MRIFCILIICSFIFFIAGCTSVKPTQVEHGCPYHVPQVTQGIRQQSSTVSYQQWIILAAYIITTLSAAIYTRHSDQKTKKKVKQEAIKDLPIVIRILKAIFRRK